MNPTIRPHVSVPAPAPGVAAPMVGVRATRVVVTVTSAVIAVCAFAFSFGNIWHLALAWGVPASIAPLVAPMLDVSVVGLLIAVRQLSLHGVPGRALAGARLLMLACAVTTWGLNTGQPVLDHRWGGVVIDSVAPALLLGWAEVGPTLLRLTTTLTTTLTPTLAATAPGHGDAADVTADHAPASGVAARRTLAATPAATVPPGNGGAGTAATPAWPPAAGEGDQTRPWTGKPPSSATAWDHPDAKGDLPHVA